MVALKPGRRRRGPIRRPRKQERRGGIETARTVPDVPVEASRSRNAVVALKLRGSPARSARTASKQERRGGIETG